jgi:hypothetical protein
MGGIYPQYFQKKQHHKALDLRLLASRTQRINSRCFKSLTVVIGCSNTGNEYTGRQRNGKRVRDRREVEGQMSVAHPSYLGGRNQEDQCSKPAQQKGHEILSQKNPSPKRAGGVAQGEGSEFKSQYCKKKKRKKEKEER